MRLVRLCTCSRDGRYRGQKNAVPFRGKHSQVPLLISARPVGHHHNVMRQPESHGGNAAANPWSDIRGLSQLCRMPC
jgi:hypothetical protein